MYSLQCYVGKNCTPFWKKVGTENRCKPCICWGRDSNVKRCTARQCLPSFFSLGDRGIGYSRSICFPVVSGLVYLWEFIYVWFIDLCRTLLDIYIYIYIVSVFLYIYRMGIAGRLVFSWFPGEFWYIVMVAISTLRIPIHRLEYLSCLSNG